MAESLVILGGSVRAAAFSAQRAGFAPHCADCFADPDLAGLSWMRYPVERIEGLSTRHTAPATDGEAHPPGTLLAEVSTAWRLPTVVDRIASGAGEFGRRTSGQRDCRASGDQLDAVAGTQRNLSAGDDGEGSGAAGA